MDRMAKAFPMTRGVAIRSIAAQLPSKRVDNDDSRFDHLEKLPIYWHPLWGIKHRRHFDFAKGENETQSAIDACQRALDAAKLTGDQIDIILCSSAAPLLSSRANFPGRRIAPRLSRVLKQSLGIERGVDTQADCLGFLANLQLAAGMIKGGAAQHVLVCAAEHASAGADFVDRMSTLPGDGAVAAILSAAPEQESDLLSSCLISDPTHYSLALARLAKNRGHSQAAESSKLWPFFRLARNGPMTMSTFVPQRVPMVVRNALAGAGLAVRDIDFFVFHQPSVMIVSAWAKGIGVPASKTCLTMTDYGVMMSASIPLTLFLALKDDKFSGSGNLVIAGAATGWSFGAQVWRVSGAVAG